ncbi:very short patch repair endonuclease [Variovorax sp. dw_954]|uniref:very short patch repair endonuclease n=1 Tax=Variovorax sp. dw_954 TaxID=2720078 RepID=UPI001BD61A46
MDKLSKEQRSAVMRQVRRINTAPELVVRRGLHHRGLRFNVGDSSLPGSPDMSFPRFRAVVFVHGCFWHGHRCRDSLSPRSNAEFWSAKITANQVRDAKKEALLLNSGWRVFTVWECCLVPGVSCDQLLDNLACAIRNEAAFLPPKHSRMAHVPIGE